MTDRYTELFAEAAECYESAETAWDTTKEAREKVNWNPSAVRVDEGSGVEMEFQTIASDD